jgi:hypothetical protein
VAVASLTGNHSSKNTLHVDPTRQCPKSKLLETWKIDAALDQLVSEPTQMRLVENTIQSSMIDLVFTREVEKIGVFVTPSEVSDHHLVIVRTPQASKPSKALKVIKKTVKDCVTSIVWFF